MSYLFYIWHDSATFLPTFACDQLLIPRRGHGFTWLLTPSRGRYIGCYRGGLPWGLHWFTPEGNITNMIDQVSNANWLKVNSNSFHCLEIWSDQNINKWWFHKQAENCLRWYFFYPFNCFQVKRIWWEYSAINVAHDSLPIFIFWLFPSYFLVISQPNKS